ncbi:MAG TPA: pantoate--beta-alanine ligase, partial [Rugosimonospora sp.]|nr:pantoate--beta-alanine ligase [Rugosimonospora sp.]
LGAAGVRQAARAAFDEVGTGTARLDYLVLTDPELGPAPARGPARLLVAAWVGTTRLIDNAAVQLV